MGLSSMLSFSPQDLDHGVQQSKCFTERIDGPHATAVDADLEKLKVICRVIVIILIKENSISIKNFVV